MKIKRLLFIALAFALAVFIVYLLSVAGEKSKGPIQNVLDKTGDSFIQLEESFMNNREDQRKEKLKGYLTYRNNIDSLRKPSKILLGASDNSNPESFETIIDLEDSLSLVFPLIHIYNAWGSKSSEQFPTLAAKTILNLGSTPVITWEPWLSDFDANDYPGIPEIGTRGKGSLIAIKNGTYDNYIIKWAQAAKEVKKPIFVRFGHEMNDPYRYPWGPQNNKPEDFVAAWKHIRQLFDSLAVENILWIWAPHPAYGYFDAFYPGDEFVDYVGIGVLNFGNAATWSKWWTFDELFGANYEKFASYDKPIMITEFGSLVVGGDRGHWFADALRDTPIKYPALKSILFFHYPADKTITSKLVSWYFIDDKNTRDSIKAQIHAWPKALRME